MAMSVLAGAIDQTAPDDLLHMPWGASPLSGRDRQVIDSLEVKRISRHQDILVEGDKQNGILFLKEGWAYRYRLPGDGRRHIINFLIPGDLIAPLFPTANHFVGALTDVVVCRASASEMDDLRRRHESLPAALQGVVAFEFEMLLERTVSLGRRNAKERMANLLVELYHRTRRAGLAGNATFDFPVTQEMLADSLGLSVVHVNRTLRSLREDGMVTVWSGRVMISDLDRLKALAGIDESPYLTNHAGSEHLPRVNGGNGKCR